MNQESNKSGLVSLDVDGPFWDRFYSVHPLVIIGTREEDGAADLAPKHLAMPMSWQNHFGFVCTPAHGTYQNILRTGEFAVTFVRPAQTVLTVLTATPRCEDGSKPITAALPTFKAGGIDCDFLQDGYLFLECKLVKMIDEIGDNSLVLGRVEAARVAADALRHEEQDDQQLVAAAPLLAYLYPDRFAEITASNRLPFPTGFKR